MNTEHETSDNNNNNALAIKHPKIGKVCIETKKLLLDTNNCLNVFN